MTEFRHFNPRAQTVTKLLYWQCACGVTTTATISGETSEVLQDGSTLGVKMDATQLTWTDEIEEATGKTISRCSANGRRVSVHDVDEDGFVVQKFRDPIGFVGYLRSGMSFQTLDEAKSASRLFLLGGEPA